ncbi:MAG: hypothetical protein AAGC96_21140 [Pseudomonadota bacterium]
MALQSIVEKAAQRINETLSVPLSEEDRQAIARIVEQAVIDSAVSASQRCASVVGVHLEHEEDKAHQISEKLKREETALIANLMGMR